MAVCSIWSALGGEPFATLTMRAMCPRCRFMDDQIARERVTAIADLYYIYQHERLGVFRAVLKLQELFRAGSVRLFGRSGRGRACINSTENRFCVTLSATGAQPIARFSATPMPRHRMVQLPISSSTSCSPTSIPRRRNSFRTSESSEVIRPDGRSETFGSMAVVRRAGLDLRHNLKQASYGHVAVLRTEVMSLIEAAFSILEAADIRNLFGAPTAWGCAGGNLEASLERNPDHLPAQSDGGCRKGNSALAG